MNKERRFQPLYWTVIASALVLFLMISISFFSGSIIGPDDEHVAKGPSGENTPLAEGEEVLVDLSDIEQMNIGAQMPRLLYGDENIVIMQGTFGVVVYDRQDSVVTNRISHEHMKSHGIQMMIAAVSLEGETIYIGNDDMYNDIVYSYQYNINTKVLKEASEQPASYFISKTIEPTPGYNEEYDTYFDLHYLISDSIVDLGQSFIYLRSSDWNMKNLQVIVCQYENGESEVFDVFK